MSTRNSLAATAASNRTPSRIGLRIWLVVSQLATVALFLPWFVAAMMSFMAFDAGVSTSAVVFVVAVWMYPLLPLVCIILAWVAFNKERNRLAAILSGVPLLPWVILGFLGLLLSLSR